MLFGKSRIEDYYCGGQKMMWNSGIPFKPLLPRDYLRQCIIDNEVGLFHGWTNNGDGIVELAGRNCMLLPANQIKFIDEDNFTLKEITKCYNEMIKNKQKKEE